MSVKSKIGKVVLAIVIFGILQMWVSPAIVVYIKDVTKALSVEDRFAINNLIALTVLGVVITAFVMATINNLNLSGLRKWIAKLEVRGYQQPTLPPDLLAEDAKECEECGKVFHNSTRPSVEVWKDYRLERVKRLEGKINYQCPLCEATYETVPFVEKKEPSPAAPPSKPKKPTASGT